MRHKGGHWQVHEESIACKAVWQKAPNNQQKKIKPKALELRLSEGISQELISSFILSYSLCKVSLVASKLNLLITSRGTQTFVCS